METPSASRLPCVLIVDDDRLDRRAAQSELGSDFIFLEANSAPLATSLIHSHTPDCVLLDYHVPGADTMAILETCVGYHIPVVVFTGVGSETIAADVLKSGAVDYLPKTKMSNSSLTRAITNAIDKGILKRLLHEKQKELESFVGTAAHDLKAPLRTVVQQCQLAQMLSPEALETDVQVALDTAADTSKSLIELVEKLLEYTETGQSTRPFEAVDLDTLARQVVAELDAVIREIDAVVEIDPLPPLQGDPTRLRQLLQNLIGNALKFRSEEPPYVKVSTVHNDGWWQLRISDNGIGIEPEYQKQIFQPLTRLHSKNEYEGSGLGLAICNKIVRLHGGMIWVESTLGQGSTFVINFPGAAKSEN